VLQQTRQLAQSLATAAILTAAIALPARAQQLTSGIDTTTFDHSVRPQDDFYRYVNGGWLKSAQIPADASSWGAFQELRENSRNAEHELFESASNANAPAGSSDRKVGDLYASYMDTARVDKFGAAPLAQELKSIGALKSSAQLPATFAHFARLGINGPVGVFEFDAFSHGTEVVARAIAASGAFSIAGGGDTLAAIAKYGIEKDLGYISTGGGAFLEMLEGRTLPAIEILERRARETLSDAA